MFAALLRESSTQATISFDSPLSPETTVRIMRIAINPIASNTTYLSENSMVIFLFPGLKIPNSKNEA